MSGDSGERTLVEWMDFLLETLIRDSTFSFSIQDEFKSPCLFFVKNSRRKSHFLKKCSGVPYLLQVSASLNSRCFPLAQFMQ